MGKDVALKDYVDARLLELRLYIDMRDSEIQRAAGREVNVTEIRLEKLNEVREQLSAQFQQFSAQISLYLTRAEYSARHDLLVADVRHTESIFARYVSLDAFQALQNDMRNLADWKANLNGRLWAIFAALGVLQILISVMRYMVDHS